MKLLADLHTHSKNSRLRHGKSSIEEMAIEANERGLVEIGITDHGYSHFFRTSKDKIKEARKTVDEINKWSKTKVLLGVEADIISEDGTLDIDNETLSLLDILIVSYHRMTVTDFANFFGFAKKTEEAKKKCANAFVNAINKYPVTIVAHLDSILETDLYEIGKACRENGTLVEINNRHTKWNEKQVQDLIDSGCIFAVSSDAHTREAVGEVDKALEIIRKYNIPSERIANIEFAEEEKSEEDRKYSAYQSVYEQIAKAKRDREFVLETKRKTEITGRISSEMENELRKIAEEKGLEYQEVKRETVEEGYMKAMSDEDIDLVKQAEEYIRNQKLEDAKRESTENFDEEETLESFDDNHPLVRESFEEKFQPFNKSVIGIEEEESESIAVQPKVEENSNVGEVQQANVATGSAYDQLNSSSSRMQEFRNIMSSGSDAPVQEVSEPVKEIQQEQSVEPQQVPQKQVFKKVEPENFMDSITRTRLVNGAKPVNVSQQAQQPKTVQRNPVVQRGGRGGGFIAVDGLLGGNKK